MGKIRIGNHIYNVVESWYHPGWAIGNVCGVVKMGIDGEFIEWYA